MAMCACITCLSVLGCKDMHLPNIPVKMETEPHLIVDPLVNVDEISECGMRYVIFREMKGGMAVINLTKDSLEVLLSKRQLYQGRYRTR